MKTPVKSERGRNRSLFLFAPAFPAVTLWFSAPTLWSVARELQTLSFAPIEARVVSFGPRAVDNEARYVLEYRYERGAREYTGLRRFPSPGPLPREESIANLLSGFTEGTAVVAYVNPFDPADAVTSPGLRATTLYPLLWITPVLILSLGVLNFAWRTWWGPRSGELSDGARVLDATGGDWTLRVMGLAPWAQGATALGMAALLAALVLAPEGNRPYLSHLVSAWAVILAIALAVYALTAWRMRSGAYDWRYCARSGRLRTPAGKSLKRSDFSRLSVTCVERKDDDGDPVHDAIVQLHPRDGPPLDVVTGSSHDGAEKALSEVRPVVSFLEERLGLRAD